jgi:hypothetical protein
LLSTCSSSTIEERKIEKKTLSEEEFLEIYNGEGNHSAWQSAQIVFGKVNKHILLSLIEYSMSPQFIQERKWQSSSHIASHLP